MPKYRRGILLINNKTILEETCLTISIIIILTCKDEFTFGG